MNENKGYKFKIEFTESNFYPSEESENAHDRYDIKFTAYGDNAKETVRNIDVLRDEHYKFMEKWASKREKTFDDKETLT